MDLDFYKSIANTSAHRISRENNANLVLETPKFFDDLIAVAFDTDDKNHFKACWVLELVSEKNITLLSPHFERFSENLSHLRHDGAIRSCSKICWFIAENHSKQLKNDISFLSDSELKTITDACFDWLIGNNKVAAKVYAMRALFEIGKQQPWIFPELKSIIELGYLQHSAAYRAVSKMLLKKLR